MSSIVACCEAAADINLWPGSPARPTPVTAKSLMKTSTTIPRTPSHFAWCSAAISATMRKVLMGRPFLMKLAASLGES
jgi:hypothetical protein